MGNIAKDLLESPDALVGALHSLLMQESGDAKVAECICMAWAAADGGNARMAAAQLEALGFHLALSQKIKTVEDK